MLTIWKLSIDPLRDHSFEVEWPMGSQIVHAGLSGEPGEFPTPAVWFRCDPEQIKVKRRFVIVVTGEEMTDPDAAGWIHRGTFIVPTPTISIVLHLMETT